LVRGTAEMQLKEDGWRIEHGRERQKHRRERWNWGVKDLGNSIKNADKG